jgi:hypothetical protein
MLAHYGYFRALLDDRIFVDSQNSAISDLDVTENAKRFNPVPTGPLDRT